MSATVYDFSGDHDNVLGRVAGGGSIRFCPKCGVFGLRYGVVHFRISPQDLLEAWTVVDGEVSRLREQGHPTEQVQIPVGGDSATLIVWPGQLLALRDLLAYGVDLATTQLHGVEPQSWSN